MSGPIKHPAPAPKSGAKGCLAIMLLVALAIAILVGISSIVSEGPGEAVSMQQ